ncbi:MAG: thioesterase family protein [Verrucomicrobiota bacterium]
MDAPVHHHACEVAFGDTDASGWMHFPNIFRYFEEAEHAFLKSRGLLVFDRSQGGWPRVKVSCDFKRPLLTGDRIEVLLEISKIGNSSITWNFEVLTAAGETAAHGSVTTVRVNHQGLTQAISQDERDKLGH